MCDQAAWNRSSRRAGDLGGARAGKCRWVRIWAITAGSTIAAMICKRPPQLGQYSISISNTRSSQARANSCAPVNHARARDRRRDRLPAALEAQRSPRAAWRGVRERIMGYQGVRTALSLGSNETQAGQVLAMDFRQQDTALRCLPPLPPWARPRRSPGRNCASSASFRWTMRRQRFCAAGPRRHD